MSRSLQRTAYIMDAFTGTDARGNPAAVVPLDEWVPDARLQALAAELDLSETAFFVPQGEGFHLRWFTPTLEVNLCGHATLASSFVLFEVLKHGAPRLEFQSLGGRLGAERREDLIWLHFPLQLPAPSEAPADLVAGLGLAPEQVTVTAEGLNYCVVYRDEDQVRRLAPDMARLAKVHPYGVIVTAPGREVDFVSRYFAPSYGIPEDPVTGSAHCALVPYWAGRLGKRQFKARQLSARGGELLCRLGSDHVDIGGRAVLQRQLRVEL